MFHDSHVTNIVADSSTVPPVDKTYKFSVDLAAVEHLGLNLYSNTAAALTEIIANAWDADATEVHITVDDDFKKITIKDNGHGMSVQDINEKFLKVAYKRRLIEPTSPSGRPVMGRKGIGKLALFSIAQHIDITSRLKNHPPGSLSIDVNELKDHIENKTNYHPKPIKGEDFDLDQGTRFILTGLLTSRLNQSITAMKKRIARRFSIIGDEDSFNVYVNDEKIDHKDRDDFRNLQFAWTFENGDDYQFPKDVKGFKFNKSNIDYEGNLYNFDGWVGTALKPKDLNTEDMGNLNGISIISRGRVFQENILDKISENRIMKSYVTGVIQADFLDADASDDLATSDRQRVREDDPRYIALTKFIKSLLNNMYDTWSKERKKYDVNQATKDHPKLQEWFDSLATGHKRQAEELIATVASLKIDEKDEDDRKGLYRSTILAFERLKLEGSAHELSEAINKGPEALIQILSNFDNYEVSLYLDLVKNRLSTIEILDDKVDNNEYENKIRDFIYEHLWLIDPSWERVIASQFKETAVHKMFDREVKSILDEDEIKGRLDLCYRNIGGDHIILELKRPDVGYKLNKYTLMAQGEKYRDALYKSLHHHDSDFTNKERIKIVFLIGSRLEGDPKELEKIFDGINARVSTYGEMLEKARSSYADFIEKTKEADKTRELIAAFS